MICLYSNYLKKFRNMHHIFRSVICKRCTRLIESNLVCHWMTSVPLNWKQKVVILSKLNEGLPNRVIQFYRIHNFVHQEQEKWELVVTTTKTQQDEQQIRLQKPEISWNFQILKTILIIIIRRFPDGFELKGVDCIWIWMSPPSKLCSNKSPQIFG